MKRATLGVAALALLLSGTGAAEAGMIQAGDLIVVDHGNGLPGGASVVEGAPKASNQSTTRSLRSHT